MSRLTINSNIPSLNAQRNLGNATKSLETSFTRLSSGLRINKASDDAAGLSISESLKADTRIFNQGIRNLNDGLSLLSIADGALNELTNIVTRLSELAEQSANGTLGNKQRLSLDQEAQSLSKEYNRIARSTEFNGRKIFNGDFGDLSLAAGGGSESMITSGLGGGIGDGSFLSVLTSTTGVSPMEIFNTDIEGDGDIDIYMYESGDSTISVLKNDGSGNFSTRITYQALNSPNGLTFNDFDGDGIKDLLVTSTSAIGLLKGNSDGSFNALVSTASSGNAGKINSADLNGDGLIDLVTQINQNFHVQLGKGDGTFEAKKTYFLNQNVSSNIVLEDFNGDGILDIASTRSASAVVRMLGNGDGSFGNLIYIAGQSLNAGLVTGDVNNDGIADLVYQVRARGIYVITGVGDGSFNPQVGYDGNTRNTDPSLGDFDGDGNLDIVTTDTISNSLKIFIGNGDGSFREAITFFGYGNTGSSTLGDFDNDGALDIALINSGTNTLSIYQGNSNDGVSALQSFSLRYQTDARDSMSEFRKVLERLGQQRGAIGAFQSRVETAVSNLQQSSLAYSEANSRITDVDVAEESSKLTANQILQQAAVSVLAQANLQPRLVLKLLQDI